MNAYEVMVIVPNGDGGVSVVSLGDLAMRVDDYDTLDAAVVDCAIDCTFTDAECEKVVDPVRQLNATGDADHYWSVR